MIDHPLKGTPERRDVSGACGSYFNVSRMQQAIVATSASRGQRAMAKVSGTSIRCRFVSTNLCSVLLIVASQATSLNTMFGGAATAPWGEGSAVLMSCSMRLFRLFVGA